MVDALLSGARLGLLSPLKKWLLGAGASVLRVLVVPGPDVARALGLDLGAAGLETAATPNAADVLLVTGPLPPKLAEQAAVLFAQMPRPRLLVFAGLEAAPPLPAPDVVIPLHQAGLEELGPAVRQQLVAHGWSPDAQPYEPAFIRQAEEQKPLADDHAHHHPSPTAESKPTEPAPPEHGAHAHHATHGQPPVPAPAAGQEPPAAGVGQPNQPAADQSHPAGHHHMAGMDMSGEGNSKKAEEAVADDINTADNQSDMHMGAHDKGAHNMGAHDADTHDMSAHDMGAHDMDMADMSGKMATKQGDMAGMDMPGMDMAGMDMTGGDMAGMDMTGGDMAGMDMGFMSMVAMTKDLPRSADGLPMEATEVAFGPFFPGLPGGLQLRLHLDGDTVTKAQLMPGTVAPDYPLLPVSAAQFAEWLAGHDRLAPVAYRVLAHRALSQALGQPAPAAAQRWQVSQLEQTRLASHLNWLAGFGLTIGNHWLQQAAERLHGRMVRETAAPDELPDFVRRVKRLPLLRHSLSPVGELPELLLHHCRGPVARAAGLTHDARLTDPAYQPLGFASLVINENNAWGRLLIRLDELTQSQQLLRTMQADQADPAPAPLLTNLAGTGQGSAAVETPRGTATLTIQVQEGQVVSAVLHPPSVPHAALVRAGVRELELGDALKTIASLDISPWELTHDPAADGN
jgi:Ni,Fe-hydrogenase III large subunit